MPVGKLKDYFDCESHVIDVSSEGFSFDLLKKGCMCIQNIHKNAQFHQNNIPTPSMYVAKKNLALIYQSIADVIFNLGIHPFLLPSLSLAPETKNLKMCLCLQSASQLPACMLKQKRKKINNFLRLCLLNARTKERTKQSKGERGLKRKVKVKSIACLLFPTDIS